MTTDNSNFKKQFDLEERTARAGESVIEMCQLIKLNTITKPIVSQLIRSATSVGANYCEANECNSKKDFYHKITLSKKEAKETLYWLRMLSKADKTVVDKSRKIYKEIHELLLIFAAIVRNK